MRVCVSSVFVCVLIHFARNLFIYLCNRNTLCNRNLGNDCILSLSMCVCVCVCVRMLVCADVKCDRPVGQQHDPPARASDAGRELR